MAIRKKLQSVKLLLTDVDGVLTTGGISYDAEGKESKTFHVKDGFIVSYLKQAGIQLGIITGRSSQIVSYRAKELGIDFVFQGTKDKLKIADNLRQQLNLQWEEVAYLGDDWNDMALLQQVGFAAIPADAAKGLNQQGVYQSTIKGGQGFFREISEMLLESRDIWPPKI